MDMRWKVLGEHDFEIPEMEEVLELGKMGNKTFSVGVFQWISGKGSTLRCSAARVRVSGAATKSGYRMVFEHALLVARQLNEGRYRGPKTLRVLPA